MRFLFTYLFILPAFVVCQAQVDTTIRITNAFASPYRMVNKSAVVGHTALLFKEKGIVERIDAEHLQSSFFTTDNRSFSHAVLLESKDGPLIFNVQADSGRTVLYWQSLHAEGNPLQEKKIIRSEEGTITEIRVQQSFNGNRILLYYLLSYVSEGQFFHDVMAVQVFDRLMNPLWYQTFSLPVQYKVGDIFFRDVDDYASCINDSGRIAVVFKMRDSTNVKQVLSTHIRQKYAYRLQMIFVEQGRRAVDRLTVPLEDWLATSWAIKSGPENMFCLAGFYKREYTSQTSNGIFCINISDRKERLFTLRQFPFSLDFCIKNTAPNMKRLFESRYKETGEASQLRFNLRKFSIENDGAFVITGEQEFTATTYPTAYNSYAVQSKHYTNDIVLARITPDLSSIWMQKIAKRQRAYKGISFKLFSDSTCYHVAYFDQQRNLNLPDDQRPLSFRAFHHKQCLVVKSYDRYTGMPQETYSYPVKAFTGSLPHRVEVYEMIAMPNQGLIGEWYTTRKEKCILNIQ